MIYNSWNIVYRVIFDGDNQNLQEDFDKREDAMEYALKNIADKPTVLGTEVFVDEGGAIVDESEPEVIFSYKDEEEQEFDTPAEPTVAELDDTIEHLDVDNPFKMDVPELSTEKRRTDTEILAANLAKVIDEWEWEMNKAIPDPITVPTPLDTPPVEVEQAPEEPEIEDAPIFTPFDTDFTDVSADEAKYSDLINNSMDPTEFLKDLAAQLGIADQVKIMPTETPEVSKDEIGIFDIPEMPDVEPTEIVDDDDVEYPDPVEEVEHDFTPSDVELDVFDDEAKKEDTSESHLLSKTYLNDLVAKGELKGAEEFEKEYKARGVEESSDDEDCHCEDGVCACDDDAPKALEEVFDGGREDVIFLNCDWCGKQHLKEELQPEEEIGFLCPTCAEALLPQSKKTKLSESQSQEIGNTYRKLSDYYGVDLDELVYGPEGFMQTKYPNGFDVPADIIYLEDKWTEFEQWLKDTMGVDFEAIRQLKEFRSFPMLEADGGAANGMTVEDIAEMHKVTVEEIEAQVKLGVDIEQEHTSDPEKAKVIALDHLVEFPDYYTRLVAMEKEAAAEGASPVEEYYDQKDHTIPSTQELKGIDNAVVPCKVADVVTHSEDEKPVDCKGEKPPLTKPLTEEDDMDEDDMDDLELAAKLEEVRQQRLKLKK